MKVQAMGSVAPSTQRLLAIAESLLNGMSSDQQPVPEEWLDRAIMITLLSASAIESELNHFVAMHGLAAKNKHVARFLGILLSKHYRTGITAKLGLVRSIYPSISGSSKLSREVENLISCRNKIVHPNPAYDEIVIRRPQIDPVTGEPLLDESGEALFIDLAPQQVLISRQFDGLEVKRSFEHFRVATELVPMLRFPPVEWSNEA